MNNSRKISIHDNSLLGYEVDMAKRKISLRTEFIDKSASETADVIFNDVIAYQFVNDSFGTILYEIEEVDSNQIAKENWMAFEDGWKSSGWPGEWTTSLEKASVYLSQNSIKGFYIRSSIGMSGWILAKSIDFQSSK